jgi:Helicase conserved C-terminal domain
VIRVTASDAPPSPDRIRAELAELVVNDLRGPIDGEFEEFAESPVERYIVGRLAPAGTVVRPEEQDDLAPAEADRGDSSDREHDAPNVPSLFPSSLGMTVHVDGSVDRLKVSASWARYERAPAPEGERVSHVNRRVPLGGEAVIELRDGELRPSLLHADAKHVVVKGRARRYDGNWMVSLFLVNAQPASGRGASSLWLFQAEMAVSSVTDGSAIFLRRALEPRGGNEEDRSEQRRLAMVYRFMPEFAFGHGCGVAATHSPHDPSRAVLVRTATVPSYEIPMTDVPNSEVDADLPQLADVVLDMAGLAELEQDRLEGALRPLVDGYRAWIEQREAELDDPAQFLDAYQSEAQQNLRDARQAADRIEAGVRLVATDRDAFEAFRFANMAMRSQRVHTKAAAARHLDSDLPLDVALAEADVAANRSWRPFQLAFVLLNLPSLADPAHPERSDDFREAVADLLWFPTGGGKTEAYLGLTAFTLAIRRLRPDLGGLDGRAGVAVLMRYTLRLLTIQQFQRATALICACESLRRADVAVWGAQPFRIGLWVGSRVTPNYTDDADEYLRQLRSARGRPIRASGSPYQLTSCPWCGTGIEPGRDIEADMVERRTRVLCPDYSCEFSSLGSGAEGLPVVVVDEEIYRLLPSVVVATVDKFAQLPWRGETQALFGHVTKRCERHGYLTSDLESADWESATHPARGKLPASRRTTVTRLRPPDLIIQDELHLISGPLGSMVGLYETAVDRLSVWQLDARTSVRPKVIASTATVRRADKQIGALFLRSTRVFPPPGLRVEDNCFARQRPTDERPGRMYVGICAQGTRMKSTLIRVYVAILGAAQKLHEQYGKNPVTDPYMTLVGYFGSLRDLGGMRRLVEDDVSARLTRVNERGLARRLDPLLKELTSRLSSSEIPEILDQLGLPFPKQGKGPAPIDVLLATNMIAVGVDVSRLGVMVVANQPKSTAEYIQATSRVGRAAPGLVITVFNWARPRDLSHFETFENFHATIYRHVEALSVTPFAERAIDRGLTGLLVSLVRNLEPSYNGNLGAQDFDRHGKLADHVVGILRRRAEGVTGDRAVGQRISEHLDDRLDYWAAQRTVLGRRLAYRKPRNADDVAGLLREPEEGAWRQMTCLNSLRDVEPGIQLLLAPEDLDDSGGTGHDTGPAFVQREIAEEPTP